MLLSYANAQLNKELLYLVVENFDTVDLALGEQRWKEGHITTSWLGTE